MTNLKAFLNTHVKILLCQYKLVFQNLSAQKIFVQMDIHKHMIEKQGLLLKSTSDSCHLHRQIPALRIECGNNTPRLQPSFLQLVSCGRQIFSLRTSILTLSRFTEGKVPEAAMEPRMIFLKVSQHFKNGAVDAVKQLVFGS